MADHFRPPQRVDSGEGDHSPPPCCRLTPPSGYPKVTLGTAKLNAIFCKILDKSQS